MATLPALQATGTLLYINMTGAIILPALQTTVTIAVQIDPEISTPVILPGLQTTIALDYSHGLSVPITLPSFQAGATIDVELSIDASFSLPAFQTTGTLYIVPEISTLITLPSLGLTGTINRALLADAWAIRPRNEIYSCTLATAGAGSGVVIPISSWQARFRTDDAQSYVSVVIPGISDWQDVFDRQNGTLTISKGYKFLDNNEEFLTAIITADIESIANDEGPRSAAINITGYTTLVEAPKTVTVEKLYYKAIAMNGTVRWRMPLYLDIDSVSGDFFIKPGDTVEYGAESLIVDYIAFNVSKNQEVMEMTSA